MFLPTTLLYCPYYTTPTRGEGKRGGKRRGEEAREEKECKGRRESDLKENREKVRVKSGRRGRNEGRRRKGMLMRMEEEILRRRGIKRERKRNSEKS